MFHQNFICTEKKIKKLETLYFFFTFYLLKESYNHFLKFSGSFSNQSTKALRGEHSERCRVLHHQPNQGCLKALLGVRHNDLLGGKDLGHQLVSTCPLLFTSTLYH